MGLKPRGAGRLTQRQWQSIKDAILEYVRNNPDCSAAAIAAGIGVDSRKVLFALRMLKAEKKIRTRGQRASPRYYMEQ